MKVLLDELRKVQDKRSRHGRYYPLYGLLGVLLLAAMHGENSLRGMYLWAKARADRLAEYEPLGLRGKVPSLGTFWYALRKVESGELEAVLRGWVEEQEKVYAIDGKVLRGSKREKKSALGVVAMVGHTLRQVVMQQEIEDGDELEAALKLLTEVPLEGKIVSADAGILKGPFAQAVVEKGGPI